MAVDCFKFAGRLWPVPIVEAIGHIGANGRPTGMTRRHIVYTRPDGGVSICTPSLTAMCFMTYGGGRWDDVISHEPSGFLERQIAEQAKGGAGEPAARRFVMALHAGGLTIQEAYEVMRDRFCAHLGTGCEIWATEDIPADRIYRDAWRRSHNGGPIWIDEDRAQQIDEVIAWQAYEAWQAGSQSGCSHGASR